MKISKGTHLLQYGMPSEQDMAAINEFTKRTLNADDVFTFSVLLCDNEVDRDYERFTIEALYGLEKLFLGKTGIFDHEWSSDRQKARIYKTEVVCEDEKRSSIGEPYTYLKAYAYMLRTENNSEIIAEIEGGIKREVSIGCAVKKSSCSICSEESDSMKCGHVRGKEYDGMLCYIELVEPTDAYEWSFVAVPAQKMAGVMKKYGDVGEAASIDDLIEKSGVKSFSDELAKIRKLAEIGDKHMKELKAEVVRLGILSDCGMKKEFLKNTVEKMDEEELMGFKSVFESKIDKIYPIQLGQPFSEKAGASDSEFMI